MRSDRPLTLSGLGSYRRCSWMLFSTTVTSQYLCNSFIVVGDTTHLRRPCPWQLQTVCKKQCILVESLVSFCRPRVTIRSEDQWDSLRRHHFSCDLRLFSRKIDLTKQLHVRTQLSGWPIIAGLAGLFLASTCMMSCSHTVAFAILPVMNSCSCGNGWSWIFVCLDVET